MDSKRARRASMKSHSPHWKEKLRKNCLERAKEERSHVIWKLRTSMQSSDPMAVVHSSLRELVSDELRKIKCSSDSAGKEVSEVNGDDMLWEFDGLQLDPYASEIEDMDMLLEIEKVLYDDLNKELVRRALEDHEEEEERLANAVYEQLQLHNEENRKDDQVWCPTCMRGELSESHFLICCTRCDFQLNLEGDKTLSSQTCQANLKTLRDRLAEVYEEHLNGGCKAKPSFSIETSFDITGLYVRCQACNTFDIVL